MINLTIQFLKLYEKKYTLYPILGDLSAEDLTITDCLWSSELKGKFFKMAIERSGSDEKDLAVTGFTVGNLKSSSFPESAKSQPVLRKIKLLLSNYKSWLRVMLDFYYREWNENENRKDLKPGQFQTVTAIDRQEPELRECVLPCSQDFSWHTPQPR